MEQVESLNLKKSIGNFKTVWDKKERNAEVFVMSNNKNLYQIKVEHLLTKDGSLIENFGVHIEIQKTFGKQGTFYKINEVWGYDNAMSDFEVWDEEDSRYVKSQFLYSEAQRVLDEAILNINLPKDAPYNFAGRRV
jgi:hypothetical protein